MSPKKQIDHAKLVADAEAAVVVARRRVFAARDAVRLARAAAATAVMNYQGEFPKVTAEAVHREGIARSQARKLAIAHGLEVDERPARPAPASHIDAVMQSGIVAGSSADYGYRRARGRLPGAVKLPSDR